MDACNHVLYKFLTVADRREDPEVVWIPFIEVGLDLNASFLQNVFHHLAVIAERIKLTCSNVSWWIPRKIVAESGELSWVGNIRADRVLRHNVVSLYPLESGLNGRLPKNVAIVSLSMIGTPTAFSPYDLHMLFNSSGIFE